MASFIDGDSGARNINLKLIIQSNFLAVPLLVTVEQRLIYVVAVCFVIVNSNIVCFVVVNSSSDALFYSSPFRFVPSIHVCSFCSLRERNMILISTAELRSYVIIILVHHCYCCKA